MAKEPEEVSLYNANDALVSRKNGGPFLDDEMAKQQELQNAARTGRKPNLSVEHLRTVGHPGVSLVTEEQLKEKHRHVGRGEYETPTRSYGKIPNPTVVAQKAQERKNELLVKRADSLNNLLHPEPQEPDDDLFAAAGEDSNKKPEDKKSEEK